MDIKKIIRDIKEDKLSQQELIECLEIPQKFVINNAIIKIISLQINNLIVVDKLVKITQYKQPEHEFMDSITLGHLATAALEIINTVESRERYQQIFETLSQEEKENVLNAIDILNDLIKNS